jgi:hypothetical protein
MADFVQDGLDPWITLGSATSNETYDLLYLYQISRLSVGAVVRCRGARLLDATAVDRLLLRGGQRLSARVSRHPADAAA